MAYPEYIRERAIQMRVERDLTIDEIAERLALPRTTVYYWVRDIPLKRERDNWKLAQVRATEATVAKYKKLRDEAYAQGRAEWDELSTLPTFREFVALYLAEGYKRCRNSVSICNSDPSVVVMAASWFRRLGVRKLDFQVQYHADQSVEELREFWSATLNVDGAAIRFFPKANSGQLKGRTWRCEYGVLAVRASDTLLRARLQAWMDKIREGWTLDCASSRGV